MLDNSILVLSANCQGLQNLKKRADVINFFRETNAHIICLQDTHLTEHDSREFKNIWEDTFFIHGRKTNSRGVAILFRNNFDFTIQDVIKDSDGNLLHIQFETFNMKFNLFNIYAPNTDVPNFFIHINKAISKSVVDYNIICGDFNLVIDHLRIIVIIKN